MPTGTEIQSNTYGLTLTSPAVAPQPTITRERYVELVKLAMEAVQWLEDKGLKQGEQCEFRNIAERLWFAPKGEK